MMMTNCYLVALTLLEGDVDAKGVDSNSYDTRPGYSTFKCFKHTVFSFLPHMVFYSPLDVFRPHGLYSNTPS